MKKLSGWPTGRMDRHATALLQDEPGCRVVAFTLEPGQAVPVHRSASAVIVTVFSGSGEFSGAESQINLAIGESASYAPYEPHGMTAGDDGLQFLAIITPSPSSASNG